MSDTLLVLEQLSRLHAASHDYIDKFDGGAAGFVKTYPFFRHDRWFPSGGALAFLDFIHAQIWDTIEGVVTEFCEDGELVGKVKRMQKADFIARMEAVVPAKEGAFNCLVHGDPWGHNFMFK